MATTSSDRAGLKLTNTIWSAGYLDGEGYFTFGGSPTVGVSNTHLPSLKFLRGLYGGTVGRKTFGDDRTRPAYEWRCYGKNAVAVIQAVLPFLREKAPQAMIVLHLAATKPGPEREALAAKLSRLKRVRFD